MDRRRFLVTGMTAGAAGGALLTGACGPAAARRGAPAPAPGSVPGRPIRLASNENPLGISPAARHAILEGLSEANRYPREPRQELIAAIAARHGVTAQQLQLGTGSTEILQMTVHATAPGALVVVADPTFEDVAQYAEAIGRRVVKVPLRSDASHDLARMREAAAGAPAALVFVCNPNNPTGTLTSCGEVEQWIREADERTTFVIDEAYCDFAEDPGYRSAERLAVERPGVVVVRTFSKVHGMAGLRIGYALAHPATITRLRAWSCNVNANMLGLMAARASLGDADYVQLSLAANRSARRLVEQTLDELGLARLPSHTNFVMHRIGNGPLADYIARMRERGFLVGRPFPPLTEWNRVSIGTVPEMELFVEELRGFRRRGWV
jgi:histidinol-phosphate aminotransferase